MSPRVRTRRRRAYGAGFTAVVVVAAVLFTASVAGRTPRASAGTTGPNPEVFVAASDIQDLALGTALSGGTGHEIIPYQNGASQDPIGINVNATTLVADENDDAGPFISTINAKTGQPIGKFNADQRVVGVSSFAMDPANPNLAYAATFTYNADDTGDGDAWRIDKLNLSSLTETTWVTQFPNTANPITIQSLAISPDGNTLYAGGYGSTREEEVDAIPVGNGSTPPNPASITMWTRINAAASVKDMAVSPDGSQVFVLGGAALVFLPTSPFPAAGDNHIVNFKDRLNALTVSPDGQTVYVAANLQPSAPSQLFEYNTSTYAGTGPVNLPIDADANGGSGVSGLAVTAEGAHLLIFGSSQGATPEMYAMGLPSLSVGPVTTFPGMNYVNGPENLAITPDQAPQAALNPVTGHVGSSVTLDASGSNVAYGSITRYVWDFGDGSTATTASPTVGHTYGSAGTFTVTVTETDQYGFSIPPAPGTGGRYSVDDSGQTAYGSASNSARTTSAATILPSTTLHHTTTTLHTTTTVPKKAAAPKLILNPAVGPPGSIVTVTGSGFPKNTPITITWSTSSGSFIVTSDNNGNLPARQLDILIPDVLGQRYAVASSTPAARAPFLVVPGTSEPGGDQGSYLFRSDGP